jgi:asparagine synthase (glutamine-hydrolysing)
MCGIGGFYAPCWIEQIVSHLDEPFADPSSVPLWYLSLEVTQEVKVVLSGDGGDELFAGYKRYRRHLRSAWHRSARLPILLWPIRPPGRLLKLWDVLWLSWAEAYSLRFSGMPPSLRRYLQPELPLRRGVYWNGMRRDWPNSLQALLDIDMANYLPEYILRKADLCTMAHGLELRVPLLDHRLFLAVLALPAQQRFTVPSKLIMSRICPICSELELFRQPKRGFNPSVDTYLDQRTRQAEHVLQLLILDRSLAQLQGA